jgi:CBS domain containing-hemolysin-like protein
MLPVSTSLGELLDEPAARTFSRIPLYDGTRDEVSGYVVAREVLDALARGAERDKRLSDLARPVWYLPEAIAIGNALHQFLERREHLAIVVDEFGAVSGLVTLEDLIETILGVEIVDESDRTVDMRRLAIQLRDQRLRKLREQRALIDEPPMPRAAPPE